MQTVRCLGSLEGIAADRVTVYGHGAAGLIALLAGALCDDIAGVATEATLASYLYAIEDSQPQPCWVFAPNILRAADVPHLAALIAPRPLTIADPVGFGKHPLGAEEAESALAFAADVYSALDAADAFRLALEDGAGRELRRHLTSPPRPL